HLIIRGAEALRHVLRDLVCSLVWFDDAAPPLCPYTTLFRSESRSPAAGERAARRWERPAHRDHAGARGARGGAVRDLDGQDAPIDRKSTRLNSSHVATSYAVFCSKKKIERRSEGGTKSSAVQ